MIPKRARPRPSCQLGLTLIELICGLAIASLILLVAAPGLGLYRGGKRQLETAAWRLASEMRLARQAAISTGVTSRIQFRIFNDDYKITSADEKNVIGLPEGIGYAYLNFPISGGHRLLEFKCTGAPNRGGTVGLKNKNRDKIYVIVTPATGRVRVSPTPPSD